MANAKRKMFCKKRVVRDSDGRPIAASFKFTHRPIVDVVRPEEFPEDIRMEFMINGMHQKLGDKYNVADSSEEAYQMFSNLRARLHEGIWGGFGAADGVNLSDLAYAIHKMKNCSSEKAMAAILAVDANQRKEWATNKKVKAFMAENRANRLSVMAADSDEPDFGVMDDDDSDDEQEEAA